MEMSVTRTDVTAENYSRVSEKPAPSLVSSDRSRSESLVDATGDKEAQQKDVKKAYAVLYIEIRTLR